ncbi:YicC family protein [Endozoicomonas sp. Mp262]|uniref:YicC/YloC family endoribonuclease n=1 Tax=Endozoicomonas sp. Mp262 TaxID=2919499 RepID=UPI0021DB6CC8
MTSSMTAFARVHIQEDWGGLVWEIRSVNHRYLEPYFRLPELIRDIEPSIRETLRNKLKRGKVECSLKLQLSESEQSLSINRPVLEKVKKALTEIEAEISNCQGVNPMDILQWPGMQVTEENNLIPVRTAAQKGFQEAINQLSDMRKSEGAELSQFILTRLENITEEVATLRAALPEILNGQRQRLLNRLEEVKQELDSDRLEQEMVILAQKLDVEEELDRLGAHISEVQRTLTKKGAIGRRLDFLMQELNREANTLSSKSIDAGLTQAAVNIKVLIEQMREQVQNIE